MLISRDEAEGNISFGQNVREAFAKADVFVDVNQPRQVQESVNRFIELLFCYPYHTPSRDEYGMFHAYAAALRSSALGRQVGSAICDDFGEVIALGTNEVPKAKGGLYWPGDLSDKRDWQLGYDINDKLKRNLLEEILTMLKESGHLATSISVASGALKKTQIMDILEFNRTVHAEMAAITDAARRGISTQGMTLYVTTFPCHECTRHIVAAGIKRVVYIDPYPKSRAERLHRDSIVVDNPSGCGDFVNFHPFVGISPRQYISFFAAAKRKDQDGNIIHWESSTALPRDASMPWDYFSNEQYKLNFLFEIMVKKGMLQLDQK